MRLTLLLLLVVFMVLLIRQLGSGRSDQMGQTAGAATSPGTITQLVAKGAQDIYLTNPGSREWEPYPDGPYRAGIWE